MGRFINLMFLFVLFTAGFQSNASAAGFGLVVFAGGEEADRTDALFAGGGLVFDTTVARDSLFNYRLTIGAEQLSEGFSPYNDDKIKLSGTGLIMEHDFGFAIVRTRPFRLWLGPELRLSILNGKGNQELTSFGTGLALGGNINLGPVISITLKTSYLFTTINGTSERRQWFCPSTSSECTTSTTTKDISSSGNRFALNLGLIFRFGDKY